IVPANLQSRRRTAPAALHPTQPRAQPASTHHFRTLGGATACLCLSLPVSACLCLSLLASKAACAGKRVAAVPPAYRRRAVPAVGHLSRGPCACARRSVRPAASSWIATSTRPRPIVWRGQRPRGVPAVAGAMTRDPVAL